MHFGPRPAPSIPVLKIAVAEADRMAVELLEPMVLDRAAADVAGEVDDDTAAVRVALLDADAPLLLGGAVEEFLGGLSAEVGRQGELAGLEPPTEPAEDQSSRGRACGPPGPGGESRCGRASTAPQASGPPPVTSR
jgi:hypothetical protein